MDDFQGRLIRSVMENPCLYNRSSTGFRNRLRRDRAWASVSNKCGLPVKQTQCKWKTLRDRFVREYHKCADSQLETNSHWRYFNQLSFLLEHIKPRSVGTLDISQLDSDDVELSTKKRYENYEPNRGYSSAHLGKMDDNFEETNATNYTKEDITLSDESCDKPQDGLEQAQEDFHKVMGSLENVLAKKLKGQTPSAQQVVANQQDPFYKYLESMLGRVDVQTRSDIQLELLNFANTLVKKAKEQEP